MVIGDSAQPTDSTSDETATFMSPVEAAIVGISAVAVVVVTRVHWEDPVVAVALGLMMAVCGWLSAIDYQQHRLPNRIVVPLAAAVTVAVVAGGLGSEDLARSGRALLFGLAASGFLMLGNLLGGLGMGDVKYAFPLAAALGWFGTQPVLTWAFTTAAIGGLAGLAVIVSGQGRRYRIPYGPFMTIGFFAGLLNAAP